MPWVARSISYGCISRIAPLVCNQFFAHVLLLVLEKVILVRRASAVSLAEMEQRAKLARVDCLVSKVSVVCQVIPEDKAQKEKTGFPVCPDKLAHRYVNQRRLK